MDSTEISESIFGIFSSSQVSLALQAWTQVAVGVPICPGYYRHIQIGIGPALHPKDSSDSPKSVDAAPSVYRFVQGLLDELSHYITLQFTGGQPPRIAEPSASTEALE